jgi:hypothetical protein
MFVFHFSSTSSFRQALCDSKIRETQTEDHIKQLAEREASKVISDYKQTEKDLQMMQDKVCHFEFFFLLHIFDRILNMCYTAIFASK